MSEYVGAKSLLEGAVYALEQCGLLLRDANRLYRKGSYATAVALAAFAQEELGRWKILLESRREVLDGASFSVKEVQKRCAVHLAKQKAGMLSLTVIGNRGTPLGNLLETRMTAAPRSSEWQEADREIQKLDREKWEEVPGERHSQRMIALYVDIASPDGWSRPSQVVTQESALYRLQEVSNDYSVQSLQRYTDMALLREHDPHLFEALRQWEDRPKLPLPEWPEMQAAPGSPKAITLGTVRRRIVRSLVVILAVIVIGYVLGIIYWPELLP